jgi:PAS domain S-box-containing protein
MSHVILFVDDEPEVLSLLRRTFPAQEGWETLTASGGREALEILRRRAVDLLVTDQRMPNMTGIELVAEARRLIPDLCAILLTAYTDPRETVEAINRGQVYRYLVKPWEGADLRQAVLRAIEQVELKRERARLTADLERRLVALQFASEITREASVSETPAALLERVLDRLPSIVPCDVAAALLAPEGGAPLCLVRPVAGLSAPALRAVLADARAAHVAHRGAPMKDGDPEVRLLGSPAGVGPDGFASRLTVPLAIEGAPAGVVVLESARADAFGDGDARVLHVLVNEVVAALRAFSAKVLAERRRLEHVVESLADGLVFAPEEADEVIANPAARRMLGLPPAGVVGRGALETALGFSPAGLVRARAGGAAEGPFAAEELRREDRTLASIVSPVPEPAGRLAGVAVVLRDVTEQKRLEARKDEFVQAVSHELRTPLTSISGALDLVLGGLAGGLSPKQERYLRMARESADRLNGMVDEILDVARLAKGKLLLEVGPCALDEVARGAVERFQPAAAKRGLEIAVEALGPVRIVADATRLGQVISNLLGNAVKYAPDHGVVRLRAFRSPALPGACGLTVWNGGEEIPETDLERIFERFEQARTDRNRGVRGTGLGLAICRGLVEAHGGAIWAESAPGQGVRFVVILPDEPPADEGGRGAAGPAAAIVVDDPDAAAIACGVLARRGIRALAASTAEDALALVRRHRPRLILFDPALPELAGVPLAGILRHDADAHDAALLAFGPEAIRESALQAGADLFVAKPAAAAALADAAAGLLERGRPTGARVLVVDDDPSIRAICAEVLAAHGYEVDQAGSCEEARRLVRARRPAAMLVDVQLPDGDGFELLEGLAELREREPFAAVFLSARGEVADKVRGLRLGADDYLTKPFDARELVARIDAALARRETTLQASPMTRLPGSRAIDREVERRLQARAPFALSYVDLDHLKSYNDTYGYAKADGILLHTAGILRDVVAAHGGEGAFLGHIGGDDFVIVTAPVGAAARVCTEAIAAFDRIIPLYYDREDRDRGFIEAADRYGTRRRFPLLSLSAATVHAAPGRYARHADLARAAAELKRRAKQIPGSVHLVEGEGAAA